MGASNKLNIDTAKVINKWRIQEMSGFYFCGKCGAKILPDCSFCVKCGWSAAGHIEPEQSPPQEKQNHATPAQKPLENVVPKDADKHPQYHNNEDTSVISNVGSFVDKSLEENIPSRNNASVSNGSATDSNRNIDESGTRRIKHKKAKPDKKSKPPHRKLSKEDEDYLDSLSAPRVQSTQYDMFYLYGKWPTIIAIIFVAVLVIGLIFLPFIDWYGTERKTSHSDSLLEVPAITQQTPTPDPTPRPTPEPIETQQSRNEEESEILYTHNNVNFRSGPSRDTDIQYEIAMGTEVEVLENLANGWSKVRHNGTIGYIRSDLLAKSSPWEILYQVMDYIEQSEKGELGFRMVINWLDGPNEGKETLFLSSPGVTSWRIIRAATGEEEDIGLSFRLNGDVPFVWILPSTTTMKYHLFANKTGFYAEHEDDSKNRRNFTWEFFVS